uniref:Uncharacterized protein n=1 Tax=Rhizophora mucronata TaxID=61149 RepID=A0A2P2NIC8_RHIMU
MTHLCEEETQYLALILLCLLLEVFSSSQPFFFCCHYTNLFWGILK